MGVIRDEDRVAQMTSALRRAPIADLCDIYKRWWYYDDANVIAGLIPATEEYDRLDRLALSAELTRRGELVDG